MREVLVWAALLLCGSGCASSPEIDTGPEPDGASIVRVSAPIADGTLLDAAVDAAPVDGGDFVVAVAAGPSKVASGTWGVSVTGHLGVATNRRYGIAYNPFGGEVKGGAGSVAYTRAGRASSGDGGVSIEKNGGFSECGSWGVAYSDTPRAKITGRVRGGLQATLVIVGRIDLGNGNLGTVARVAQVGSEVDGITIEPGVWYGLDSSGKFVKVAGP